MRAEEGREMWLTSTVSVHLSSFKYIFLNKCFFIYLLYNLRIISRVFKHLCTYICTEQIYHSAYICMYLPMYLFHDLSVWSRSMELLLLPIIK